MPPLSLGRAESHGFEHMRSGTLSLFAALNAAPGESWIKPPSVASVQFVDFLTHWFRSTRRPRDSRDL